MTAAKEYTDEVVDGLATEESVEELTSSVDASVTNILKSIDSLNENAVALTTLYFTIGDSAEDPPTDPWDEIINALVDTAIVGESIVGGIGWSTTRPAVSAEDEYIWVATLLTYVDGSTAWEVPICLTDDRTIINQLIENVLADVTVDDSISDTVASLQEELSVATANIELLLSQIQMLTEQVEALESNQGKVIYS